MRSQLLKTLIAVATASTLAACATGDRDRDTADMTSGETTMASTTTVDQDAAATTTGGTLDQSATGAGVASTDTQMGASASGQTAQGTQQYPTATAQSTASTQQQYPTSDQATMSQHQQQHQQQQQQHQQQHQQHHQSTASTTQMDSSTQAGTSSARDLHLTGVASKVETLEASQVGASGAGATASSMDTQAMCDMYARLKSVTSTEEREAIMTQMLLNMSSADNGSLVSVRRQCAS